MANTTEVPQEQRPFQLKPGSRVELTAEQATFLFKYSQGFLFPQWNLFNLLENIKQSFVDTNQVDYIDIPQQTELQMEKLPEQESKATGRVVDMFGRDIPKEQSETKEQVMEETIADPLQ